ncbi:unnamed protein product, partial [Didymodactylos carnosus]
HHYNNTINYYQNINTNLLINDDYSTKHPNPTKHHGPVDPTLELEPLMPVINKEGLTHAETYIDTYIDSHNSMGEVEEEGEQETEHEKEEKYTYNVVKENKESYNVSAPSSSQASKSEEFWEQLLRHLDLSSASLIDAEEKRLSDLVLKYANLFTSQPGCTNIIKHHIDVRDAKPIKQQPYCALPPPRDYVTQERIQMQEQNIIELATGPWAAPVTLQPKRDGTMRFYIDFRRLNAVTIRDVYPLPRVDDTLNALHDAQFFSTLDLRSGFWQVELDEERHIVSADGIRSDSEKLQAVRDFPVPFKVKDLDASDYGLGAILA